MITEKKEEEEEEEEEEEDDDSFSCATGAWLGDEHSERKKGRRRSCVEAVDASKCVRVCARVCGQRGLFIIQRGRGEGRRQALPFIHYRGHGRHVDWRGERQREAG